MACVSLWTWPSKRSILRPVRHEDGGLDGKKNVRPARRDRDTAALVRGPLAREMSASLNVDRKTLRNYIAPAAAAWIVPGGRAKSRRGVGGTGAGLVAGTGRYPAAAGDLAGDRRAPPVHGQPTGGGGAVSTIWQRLRNEHGLAVSVASLRRYVVDVRSRQGPDALHPLPSPRYRHPRVRPALRDGLDQLGHPIPQLLDLNDEDKQA